MTAFLVHYIGVTGGAMWGIEPEGGPLLERQRADRLPRTLAAYALPDARLHAMPIDALRRAAEEGTLKKVELKGGR